ncbi:MAG: hypothetical protein WCO56_01555 [Verrucomicrobiota bacterium]
MENATGDTSHQHLLLAIDLNSKSVRKIPVIKSASNDGKLQVRPAITPDGKTLYISAAPFGEKATGLYQMDLTGTKREFQKVAMKLVK